MATVEKALRDREGTMGSTEGTVDTKEAPILLFLQKKMEAPVFVNVQTREREKEV